MDGASLLEDVEGKRFLGALAAGLAHQIRNPLNGASLHLSVSERALPNDTARFDEARAAARVVRAELRRLSELVTRFLDVACPPPLVRAEGDLNVLVEAVRLLLAPEAKNRGIALRVEESPLPASCAFDSERITHVLLRLARNALEAVGERGEIVLRVRRTVHAFELDVQDDGAGLFDTKAPIFDAFYTTKERGTGLGLSLVRRIVHYHGGNVLFTRQRGHTLFTVRLPIQHLTVPALTA